MPRRRPYDSPVPQPGDDWALDKDEALQTADRIQAKIEDAPEAVADRAADFFESVNTKAASIAETIERTQRVTVNQLQALRNMESGVDKWLEH